MPQITVTLSEMTYMDLVHNLPKGLKSKFVERAVRHALDECGMMGAVIHTYARQGKHAAHEKRNFEIAARLENQQRLDVGGEEE